MEERFERYLGSDDDGAAGAFSSGAGAARYGGEALGARGRAGAGSRASAGGEYDFDIDLSKPAGEGSKSVSKQERKLAKEREKAAEADRRAARASALTKSKEERMAELLGQLSSERQAEKAAAEAARRREEEQADERRRQAEAAERRRREREADEAAATAIADDLEEHELDEPLASDSLEMSDADFEVGGYQKKRAAAAVSAPAAMSGAFAAAAAAAAAEADAAYSEQEEEEEEEEDQLATLKRRLSTQLTSGLKPEEVGQTFSMGDLASLLKHQSASPSYESPRTGTGTDDGSARGYHDDRSGAALDAGEESEHLREASEIYASFEADRESEAHSSPSPLVSSAARQGARIRARLFDWTQHYSGRVEMVRPDGRLDLHFDDGDRIGGVSPAKVIFDASADDEDEDYHRLDAGRDDGHVRHGTKAHAEDDGGPDAELRARLQEDQLLDARSPALEGGTPPSSPPRRPRPQSLSSDGSITPHRPDSPNSHGSNRSPRSPKHDAALSSPLRRPESPSSRGSPRSPKKQEQQEQQRAAPQEQRPAQRNLQQQQREQHEPNAADRIKELFWGGMADAARTPPNSPPRRGAGTSPPPPPPSTIRGRAQQPKPRHGAGKHEPQAVQTYGLSKAGQPRVMQLSSKRSSPPPQHKEHAQPQQQDKRILSQMLAHEEAALARLQEQRRGRRSGEDAQLLASIEGGLSVSGEVARLRLLCGSLEAEAEEARRKLETAAEREKRAARHAESQAAEIFRLSARVRDLEATSAVRLALRTVLRSSPEASVPREQLEAIEREMQQQERLLQGFQKENEKLVGQLRDAQRLADEVRDQMFAASARLGLGDHQSAAGAALSASQATEDGVPPPPPPPTDRGAKAAAAHDLRSRLDADKALRAAQQQLLDLRVDHAARVATLKAELDAARAATQVAAAPGSTAAAAPRDAQDAVAALRRELAEARAEHQGEAKALRSKLAWYVENQELLSANDQTIQTLRARVRDLESGGDGAAGSGADDHEEHRHAHDAKENGLRTPNAKASPPGGVGRPRASQPSDLKRIRELERTVKELEEALRKRHPDSVAQLILAAGPGEAEKETRRELRAEINSLREELLAREHSFNARLRGLRQEHERVKAAHDKQLAEARAVAAAQAWVGGAGPNAAALDDEHPHHTGMAAGHDGRVVALEAELARVRDFYRKKLEALSKKQSVALRAARRDGGSVISTPEGSAQRDADRLRAAKLALEARVEELEDALAQAGLPGMQPRHKQQEHQQQSAHSPQQHQHQLKRAIDTPGDADQHEDKGASPKQRKSAAVEGSPKGSEDDPAALLLRVQLLENENRVLTRRLEAIAAGGPAVVAAVAAAAPDVAASVSANPFSAAGVAADSHGAPAASAMTAHYERALARSEAAVKRLFAANCELEARLEETARALPAAPSLLQQQQLARRLAEVEGRLLARERELELVLQQVRQRAESDRRAQEAAHGAAMAAKNVELTRYRLELDALLESIKLLQQ